jgi:hypothetical protein
MLAAMEFRLSWEHNGIRHTDGRYAPRVNFWRDILPPGLGEAIARAPKTGRIDLELKPGVLLPALKTSDVVRVPVNAVERLRRGWGGFIPGES